MKRQLLSSLLSGAVVLLVWVAVHQSFSQQSENRSEAVSASGIGVDLQEKTGMMQATFGAGCFWGVEETFRRLDGVTKTEVGYAGGSTVDPEYRDVCSGQTGHAEVVQVDYDPTLVTYEQLLELFWNSHDPTTLNRQGPDVGTQYRSVVFFHTSEQQIAAQTSMANLAGKTKSGQPIVTQIVPATVFYPAEEYHQKYLYKRGQGSCNY